MYSYIVGKITEKNFGKVTIDNNFIGYEVFVSDITYNCLDVSEQPIKLYTFLNVREDEMTLYGFLSDDEKNIFMLLKTVSGIGPKMAISILSEISISGLLNAIASEDIKTLCKIKGLGKKTAERLLLELKDKINPLEVLSMDKDDSVGVNTAVINDAVETLIGLGIPKNQAIKIVEENYEKDITLEEIITKVLRGMGRWWIQTDL